MSYIGLNLESLVREVISLMKNNYGGQVTKQNRESFFKNAKADILETFKDIIDQNKQEVFSELNDEEDEEN